MVEIDERYRRWKLEVLEELREFIVDNLQPERLFPYLRSKFILSEDDQEDIEAERTRRRKAERMLDFIAKRGNDGFDELCEAIRRNKTQNFLVQKIIAKFEERKYNHQANPSDVIEPVHTQRQPGDHPPDLPMPGDPGGPLLPDDDINSGPTSPPPPYAEVVQRFI